MDNNPPSGNSSDRERVSPFSPEAHTSFQQSLTDHNHKQDTFEDASDVASRPTSQSERSRSRSLTKRRASNSSTARETSPSPPVPGVPSTEAEVPKTANGDSEHAAAMPAVGGAAAEKSPLLTTNRISVTEDLDDISLEEGASYYPRYEPLAT